MKVFITFILFCFIAATMLRKRDLKTSIYMLYSLALLVSLSYFFFNQI